MAALGALTGRSCRKQSQTKGGLGLGEPTGSGTGPSRRQRKWPLGGVASTREEQLRPSPTTRKGRGRGASCVEAQGPTRNLDGAGVGIRRCGTGVQGDGTLAMLVVPHLGRSGEQ
jgi:hypothetical protein